jgi:MerC mercury resistance protein
MNEASFVKRWTLRTMSAKRQKMIDGSAMGLSLLCLFHCLAMPLVLSVLPMLGAHLFEETAVHTFFFVSAVPLSFVGLWLGVRGAHGGGRLMILAGCGLVLMLGGALHEISGEYDVALTSVGVSLVALAHFLNWRRHERVHYRLPHEHLAHHSEGPCPCEGAEAASEFSAVPSAEVQAANKPLLSAGASGT